MLARYPKADVTLALASSDASEGAVFPASLTLTQANWNRPQTITITGLDDGVIDGNQAYTITIGPASSTDAAYAGIDPPDVAVVNEEAAIPPHHVGGTVIGLLGNGLVLSLAAGAETLPVSADGSFAFTTALAPGAAYAVTVATHPQAPAQTCVVINGNGTMGSADIGNIVVNCGASVTRAIGGTVNGLGGGSLRRRAARLRGRGLDRSLGLARRGRLGTCRLAERGPRLAGGRLGALRLGRLASGDTRLGGLRGGGLAGLLRDATTRRHRRPAERGVDLAGQA